MDTPSTKEEKLVNLKSIIDVKRFSNCLKLLRVTSYVMRFINRLTNNLKNNLLHLHLVDSADLKQAENLWIKPFNVTFIIGSSLNNSMQICDFLLKMIFCDVKEELVMLPPHMIRKIRFIYQSVIFPDFY